MTNTSAPKTCDLLIEAGWVVPVEPHGAALADHAVAVRDGEIIALLPIDDARRDYRAAETISRPHSVLMPGLVNAHAHNPMTLLRGVADDLPLMRWLTEHIWPVEAAVLGPQFVADGVELAIAEMLRGGTTCCNDMYFFPDASAATYRRHGFRALVGLPIIDFPTAWASSQEEYFDRAGEVHDLYRSDPMVRTCFAPHAPYTVCDASFERIRMLSDVLDVSVHCHVHETAHEVEEALRQHGMRQVARLDRLGLLNDRLIAVHMTQLLDSEIAQLAEAGASVVHCPESNLKLASGFCPAEKLRRAGVNLAIGTDGCASNNDLDMFGETRTAALLAKGVAADASAFDAAFALQAATLNGARSIGLADRIGSIVPGKQADLTAVRLDALETQPVYHVISQLVYTAGRRHVSDVWVAGVRKVENGTVLGLDTDELRGRARAWQSRIADLG